MKHDPWVVVCPVSRLPTTPSAPPVAPWAPSGVPRSVIPPSPTIPRSMAPMGVPRTGPRTTPSMGVPRQVPAAPGPRTPPSSAPTQGGASLVGRVIGDRYGVSAVIGAGGMGVVYEAEHLTIGKLVAVKVLHPSKAQNREAVSRLRHEARVAGTLGHPNICAVYDMGRLDDGSPYLVMERLHGETLAERIARLRRLAAPDMVDIMLQVLSALAAAHQRGVVHRDLKPENIFLSQRAGIRPVPKLLDFGISKAEDIEDTVADPTGALLSAGTPYYMAPEQARGDRGIDWRVDLWAAGIVLYEGLTGQRPFVANTYTALLVQILSMAHRPIREQDGELSVGLSRVVDKALAKRPDERYQSALEFQSALRGYKDRELDVVPRSVPILFTDHGEDTDATTVFHRIDAQVQVLSQAAPEEELTPICGPGGEEPVDDERTVVETPAFLNEMLTAIRAQGQDPGRKR